MMSDLVKTASEAFYSAKTHKELMLDKFLVLPSGLDELGRILKEDLDSWGHSYKVVDDVFARFKKEHGIKEE